MNSKTKPFESLHKFCATRTIEAANITQQQRVAINRNDAYRLLQECAELRDLEHGKQVQLLIFCNGLDSFTVLCDHLIRMFTCCQTLCEANQVFRRVEKPSPYTWSAIISANAKLGQGKEALELYETMQILYAGSDRYVVYFAVLKTCSIMLSIVEGRLVHDEIVESGLQSDVVLGNTLLDMYAKCGSMEEAENVFKKLLSRSLVSWNIMIAGYAQHNDGCHVLTLFERLEMDGIKPDAITFTSVLKVCISIGAIENGRLIHYKIIEHGFQSDSIISNKLIHMYAKCGSLEEAVNVFEKLTNRSVIAWGAVIEGYANHGKGLNALAYFERMQLEGIMPDMIMFLSVLKGCASIGAIEWGKLIHEQIKRSKLEADVIVGTALVDMYAKCGNLEEANEIFIRLSTRDIVAWGAMVIGYAQHGDGLLALEYFQKMQGEGICPNNVTFLGALKACASLGALENGQIIHQQIIESGSHLDGTIGSTLVDMYAKCGSLSDARNSFNSILDQSMVSWSAMLVGYAQHGEGMLALECFAKMQQAGVEPDEVIFANILIACSRAGLIDQGSWYFNSLGTYGAGSPSISNCACMIDLLGRAGSLKEAEDLLQVIIVPNPAGWTSLLSSCRVHRDVELARNCFRQVISLDPHYAPAYVLMSNIFADADMQEEALKIEQLRKCSCAWEDMD